MSKLIVIFILLGLYASTSHSYFRDETDRVISKALISQFYRECSHKSGQDQIMVNDLNRMYTNLQKSKSTNDAETKALQCYKERMPQVSGIQQLYKDLCDEVAQLDTNKSEPDTLRTMLMAQRYRRGITPYHDLLNDCIQEKSQAKYVIKSKSEFSNSKSLHDLLESIKQERPFEASQVDFR